MCYIWPTLSSMLINVVYLSFSFQQSRMEERLDDAIHVLRNHAEMPGHGVPGMAGMMPPPHSNGLMPGAMTGPMTGAMGSPYPGMGLPTSHMDGHMVGVHGPPSLAPNQHEGPDLPAMLRPGP